MDRSRCDVDVGDGPAAVLFTDIVDFVRYNAERGDDAAVELLEEQSRIVRELLPPCARVVKELGDGLMLWVPDATPRSTPAWPSRPG